jgi:hypothetical protein
LAPNNDRHHQVIERRGVGVWSRALLSAKERRMLTERTPWNPHHELAVFAAVAVILGGIAACSRNDEESSRASTATTIERRASSTTNSTPTTTTTERTETPSPNATPAAGSIDPGDCAEVQSWGTDPKDVAPMNPEDFYLVRVGQHDCFDRVVFDVNGTIDGPEAVGYSVAYVSGEVQVDGSGDVVPTAGAAALQVIVRAPAHGYGTSGHQPWRPPAQTGDDFFTPEQLRGWGSFREISFAGSFEGQSTIAVGVEAKLPFRVGSYDQEGYSHVYVDVAHPR